MEQALTWETILSVRRESVTGGEEGTGADMILQSGSRLATAPLANQAMEPTHGGSLARPAASSRSMVSWLARRGSSPKR
jgi:hypothetical protein